MTASIPVLATRVMKARRESTCPACGDVVLVGQRIARCPGRLWFHLSCYLANGGHRHQVDTGTCTVNGIEDTK